MLPVAARGLYGSYDAVIGAGRRRVNPDRLTRDLDAAQITRDTRVRHAPLAITHLRPALGTLDLTIPGEHIAIHPGVEPELRFITATDEFRVGDVPGESSDDVRIALVSRLVASGLLQVVT